jgi:hypothetical protein
VARTDIGKHDACVEDIGIGISQAHEGDATALAELHLRTALHAYKHLFPRDAPQPGPAGLIDDWARRIGPISQTDERVSETPMLRAEMGLVGESLDLLLVR